MAVQHARAEAGIDSVDATNAPAGQMQESPVPVVRESFPSYSQFVLSRRHTH